jgi:hypothetical protein
MLVSNGNQGLQGPQGKGKGQSPGSKEKLEALGIDINDLKYFGSPIGELLNIAETIGDQFGNSGMTTESLMRFSGSKVSSETIDLNEALLTDVADLGGADEDLGSYTAHKFSIDPKRLCEIFNIPMDTKAGPFLKSLKNVMLDFLKTDDRQAVVFEVMVDAKTTFADFDGALSVGIEI